MAGKPSKKSGGQALQKERRASPPKRAAGKPSKKSGGQVLV